MITYNMSDYKVIISHHTQNNLHNFTFHHKSEMPVETVNRHLTVNTALENTILAQQELGSDVIRVKRRTVKHPSHEGSKMSLKLSLFLMILASHKKSNFSPDRSSPHRY